jgi:hypothetical protein
MLLWVYERAKEDADGVRVEFNTPTPYKPGSLVPAVNGRQATTGYTTPGGTLVVLDQPPREGDIVYFSYTQR